MNGLPQYVNFLIVEIDKQYRRLFNRVRDFHAHSNYSDGRFLSRMVRAAQEAGLEAFGFTDHCSVSSREAMQHARASMGFNLDITYERRRDSIERLRREVSGIEIYDAVEMDYDPRDESEISDFLTEAAFDYALGSVHSVDGLNVQYPSDFEEMSSNELDRFVDRYFENLVSLIESELFDVAAHPDLIERTPVLRGRATETHYRRAARAFADSRTVPEINAGRALREEGIVHPSSPFLDILREHGTRVTIGTDAHHPDEVGERAVFLDNFLQETGIEPVTPLD